MQDGNTLQYVTGPIQLIGMIILVIAALVPKLTHPRDTKNRRVLVWGLLGVGILGFLGGIGLEVAKLRKSVEAPAPSASAQSEVEVRDNEVRGDANAVGVGNKTIASHDALDEAAKAADRTRGGHVIGNRIAGSGNALGVDNVANSPKDLTP